MKVVKVGFLLFASMALFACGGGGNSGTDDNDVPVVQTQAPASFVSYMDSRVQVFYPGTWTQVAVPGVTAQFLAPTENRFGGFDNCTLDYTFVPNSSLVELTDEVLDVAVVDDPEPSVSFVTVNGTPASRIDGFIRVLQFTIPLKAQIMYQASTAFLLVCSGEGGSIPDIQAILNSMELL